MRTQAMEDILSERDRQITAEGWTPAHDDKHTNQEMAMAAAAYASLYKGGSDTRALTLWPIEWDLKWWKPTTQRRNLVKAGALILAEIERLDRQNKEDK
jgi:hypothetical protein